MSSREFRRWQLTSNEPLLAFDTWVANLGRGFFSYPHMAVDNCPRTKQFAGSQRVAKKAPSLISYSTRNLS